MPRHRAIVGIAIACVTALAVAGCKNSAQVFEDQNEGGWFAKPVNMLAKPDWARPTTNAVNLGPQGPVAPEDMVSADGRCATPTAALAQAAEPAPAQPPAPADRASRLGRGRSRRRTDAGCYKSVRRSRVAAIGAGHVRTSRVRRHRPWHDRMPGRSARRLSQQRGDRAGERGERKVVLTYLSGPWPGIYTFNDGRLKVIERAPEQPKPAKAAPKKKPAKPKTASHEIERAVVR